MSGPTWLPPKQPEQSRLPQARALVRGTPGPSAHGAEQGYQGSGRPEELAPALGRCPGASQSIQGLRPDRGAVHLGSLDAEIDSLTNMLADLDSSRGHAPCRPDRQACEPLRPPPYRSGFLKPGGGVTTPPRVPAPSYGGPTPASYTTASTPVGPAFPVQQAAPSRAPPEEELERLTKKLVHDMNHPPSGEYFGRCGGCGEDVVGDGAGVIALDRVFHVGCFVCSTCRAQLRGQHFYAVERKAYCEGCYVATLEKCSMCSQPILDRILRAMGKAYHPGCFTCVVCHQGLDGIPFTVDATSQIHCIEDFHRKFAPRCSVCGGAIMPEPGQEETVRIVALDRSFHIGCYKCEECGLLLSSEGECQGCYPLDGHILCKTCSAWRIQELSATVTTDC
ncbi:thyroid receptor-interacting protein 6 isoform X3 [Notamacropus eugenii]|uniref:thyroid receptor-interacting protein 6 isoform X3 n=1 Tax=Notamacropus eugenii TaxID=9315 RepID=UPI003B67C43A